MIVVIFSILVVLFFVLQHQQHNKYAHIPGPPGLPIIGNTIEIFTNHENKTLEWARKYGPVYKYKFLFWYLVAVTDPKAIKQVLVTNEKNYSKNTYLNSLFLDTLGVSLLTIVDPEQHKKLRNAIVEAFSYQNLRLYFPIFVSKAKHLAEKWNTSIKGVKEDSEGYVVDILHDLESLTLDVIGRAAFGCDFNSLEDNRNRASNTRGSRLFELGSGLVRDSTKIGVGLLPGFRKLSPMFKAQLDRLKAISDEVKVIIDEKRTQQGEEKERQKDLLDILVFLKDENGKGLTEEELCGQSTIFLLAGHETSATALSWILYLLARHPKSQDKLAREIITSLKNKDETNTESVDGLQYLNWVVKEGLRLYPPAVVMTRKCEQADTLAGVRIPAGTPIMLLPYVIHNLEENWENASQFNPERWSTDDEDGGKHIQQGAFVPFLLGSRNCIGNRFALLEIKAILAVMIPRFSFGLPRGFESPSKLTSFPVLHAIPRLKLVVSARV